MTLCNGKMRFCRFTNFFLMVYLSYSNSYDMNCFFLSILKQREPHECAALSLSRNPAAH